jgi:hypothetical protein
VSLKHPQDKPNPNVLSAATDDAVLLPIIDVTNPAVATLPDDAALAGLIETFLRDAKQREKRPRWLEALLLRIFRRRSVLARGLRDASGGFLPGVATDLFKLGPDHLSDAWAQPVDRRIAADVRLVRA